MIEPDISPEPPNPGDNPYDKAARLIIRLAAAGLVLIGGLDVLVEFLRHRFNAQADGKDLDLTKVVINALVFLAGVVMFFLTGRLAARLAEYFED